MNIPITLELETSRASDSQRLRQLFEMAPVSLFVEDFTAVARELVHLAASGIEDLTGHLRAHPDVALELIACVVIVDANPPALRLLGIETAGELQGQILPSTLNDDAIEAFIGQFQAMWDGRLTWETTFGGRDAFGRPIPTRLGWAVPHEHGVPDYGHVMVSLTDVAELLATQRELEKHITWKDQFTASVAHELRTPVTGLVGFTELLSARKDDIGATELPEIIEILSSEAKELHRLVEDLLVAARSEAGELDLEVESVCTMEMAGESARSARSDIPVTGDGAFVLADPVRVRQIVRNLVTNVHRYGGPDRSIHVGVEGHDSYIEVSDDGPEIADERRTAIFEPFSRGGEKTVKASIGLGLSVARQLARAQGGDLAYLRRNDRNVFRLTLPLA